MQTRISPPFASLEMDKIPRGKSSKSQLNKKITINLAHITSCQILLPPHGVDQKEGTQTDLSANAPHPHLSPRPTRSPSTDIPPPHRSEAGEGDMDIGDAIGGGRLRLTQTTTEGTIVTVADTAATGARGRPRDPALTSEDTVTAHHLVIVTGAGHLLDVIVVNKCPPRPLLAVLQLQLVILPRGSQTVNRRTAKW